MFDFSAATNAALRHVYTGTAVMVGTLTVVGISQGDATAIGTAVHQIGDGVASIVTGVCTLIPIISGIAAAVKGTRTSKVADVAAMPGTTVSPDGKTIHLVEPVLVTAAKEAATPASGKPAAV